MKTILPIILVVTTVLFAALYVMERRNTQAERTKTEGLETKVEKVTSYKAAIVRLKEKNAAMEAETEELRGRIEQSESKIMELQTAAVALDAGGAGPAELEGRDEEKEGDVAKNLMSGISEMMQDPAMRETIREQIKGMQVNAVFGSLIKELGLPPAEAEAFRNLITDRYLVGMDLLKDMQGGTDQDAWDESIKGIERQHEEIDVHIKELLGDEAYARYETYKETEGERMQVGMFNQQLSFASGEGLSKDQQEQLISAMHEERKSTEQEPDYVDYSKAGPDDMSDEKIDRALTRQMEANIRIRDRAKTFLSYEQLQTLETYQDSFLKQAEMGMRLGAKMFKASTKEEK